MTYLRQTFINQLKKIWATWSWKRKSMTISLFCIVALSLSSLVTSFTQKQETRLIEQNEINSEVEAEGKNSIRLLSDMEFSNFDENRYVLVALVIVLSVLLWVLRLAISVKRG